MIPSTSIHGQASFAVRAVSKGDEPTNADRSAASKRFKTISF
jgi:hypothetical protein